MGASGRINSTIVASDHYCLWYLLYVCVLSRYLSQEVDHLGVSHLVCFVLKSDVIRKQELYHAG